MIDCHTHTEVSPDSSASLSEMCRAAREKGIRYYAVTDHVELCRWYPQAHYGAEARDGGDGFGYAARFARSMQQNQAMKAQQTADLTFISGIELGEPNADLPLAETIYRDERLDLVLASLHELPGEMDFYFLDYTQTDAEALLEAYFAELLHIARQNCFDVLAHLTYPLRYIVGRDGISVDMGKFRDCIAEIYRTLIARGKGIELNTAGFRRAYGKPSPEEELLRLYRDMGGTILTIGSDAHCPADVGGGIPEGLALARACGFDRICWYQQHTPQFVDIPD